MQPQSNFNPPIPLFFLWTVLAFGIIGLVPLPNSYVPLAVVYFTEWKWPEVRWFLFAQCVVSLAIAGCIEAICGARKKDSIDRALDRVHHE